ncbi:hypothetical protein C1170_07990 [Stutzerimonas frequens]|uniref:DUF3261 domain-containing protein n=1 Tax=Stutzerimonas frequens TaxID=2968969 RepID=A0ABX6XZ49_9GAMM|nr:DUF3261 domain-containing protein [Stutzerimonas frequens]MCQ4302360.1 DUF3261 domain-containing protein [Stutzerimonas frequens]PNF52857.1 hypothetical protein C1170_07990 [Stutzerimonas frequens]QPT19343.1 DUF3261 domain-containing protein [Stutzerimonas frequens]
MRRLLLGLCFVLLAGCATRAPLPATTPTLEVPLQLHIQRRGSEPADWLLVIQPEGTSLRWSLLDPLGIPLARQQLRDGAWHAEGQLRPNPEARELFAALLFALTDRDQLAALYGAAAEQPGAGERQLRQAGSVRWQVRYRSTHSFELDVAPGLTYRVAPLPDSTGSQR